MTTAPPPHPPATPADPAVATLHARLLELLLQFDMRPAFAEATTVNHTLTPYQHLARLLNLCHELFDAIVPRIIRQLSFSTPQRSTRREPPVQGRIDWQRSLTSQHPHAIPGEPPLHLYVRQTQRDFATPPNLLTVITILEVQQAVARLPASLPPSMHQPALLQAIAALHLRCQRELAFPQFHALQARAASLIASGTVAQIEQHTTAHLPRGGNSAYRDLLQWRTRRDQVPLWQQVPTPAPPPDPAHHHDAVYQLWLCLELANLLQQQQRLVRLTIEEHSIALHLHSDAPPAPATYCIRSLPPTASDTACLTIERTDPPAAQVTHDDSIIWREPVIHWQTRLHAPPDPASVTPTLALRLVTQMLHGAPTSLLLYAAPPPDQPRPSPTTPDIPSTTFAHLAHTLHTAPRIEPYQLAPGNDVATRLHDLLAQSHSQLAVPRVPQCHARFLHATAHLVPTHSLLTTVDNDADSSTSDPAELLICPKPHIGHWRIDIVSRSRQCCRDARVCHIVGQPTAQIPVYPPDNPHDLLREMRHILHSGTPIVRPDAPDEVPLDAITQRVDQLSRALAERAGFYQRIEVYYHRLRDIGMQSTLPHLKVRQRESLAMALFLVEQLDEIGASDYSAPAIHIASVLEGATRQRIFSCPLLAGRNAQRRYQTLGSLVFMWKAATHNYSDADEAIANWHRLHGWVKHRWQHRVRMGGQTLRLEFHDYLACLDAIAPLRNRAAHPQPLSRPDYQRLFEQVCVRGRMQIGALNGLVRAWRPRG